MITDLSNTSPMHYTQSLAEQGCIYVLISSSSGQYVSYLILWECWFNCNSIDGTIVGDSVIYLKKIWYFRLVKIKDKRGVRTSNLYLREIRFNLTPPPSSTWWFPNSSCGLLLQEQWTNKLCFLAFYDHLSPQRKR